MTIKVNNLTYGYTKSSNVLEHVSFEINKDSIVVILGLNGCGKTTLIKNLAGLYSPISGNILIDNKDIAKLNNKEKSKLISYVSQSVNHLDSYLVRDYLSFSFLNDLSFYQRPNKEHLQRVEEYANKMNISYLLDKKIDEISGGQRQLVQICASLLQNTSIIILDEPLSALDIVNQHLVLTTLKEISMNEHKTIILSSHDPNVAVQLESDVILMKNKGILVYGSYSDIITVDRLKDIYGTEIEQLDNKMVVYKRRGIN